jgi:CheY-like chemotaxis protein
MAVGWTGEGVAKTLGGVASLAWTGLAIYVVWLLRGSLIGTVNRLTGVEAWGVKFALTGGAQALAQAFEMAAKNAKWSAEAPEQDRQAALEKAKARRGVYEGAEILWIDDRPSNNRNESRMLRSFGALITFACTTDEAREAIAAAKIEAQPFDLLISDISRDLPPRQNPTAGLDMLAAFRNEAIAIPLIFYVGSLKPGAGTPAGAFGLTHRPDILLTLVGDALERTRRK